MQAFQFLNLTSEVRVLMSEEIKSDIDSKAYYVSPRLNSQGLQTYPNLLIQSALHHDAEWLTQQLSQGLLNTQEARFGKNGTTTWAKVPYTAAETLADGEFNRYYVRAICLAALKINPDAEVEVYRAKQVSNARSESQNKIGTKVKAAQLLEDLRKSSRNLDSFLGIPAGPNSGLSVKLIA
ncbi:MAG: hypothetical protein U0798_15180 [Gemmataceae bacterium]